MFGFIVAVGVEACDGPTAPWERITGTYLATTLKVTPTGSSPIDVLALGGSLTVTIAAGGVTTGTLTIPAILTFGMGPITQNMAGGAVLNGSIVTFHQTADTFISDLNFHMVGNTLHSNDTAGGSTYEIVLTRQ